MIAGMTRGRNAPLLLTSPFHEPSNVQLAYPLLPLPPVSSPLAEPAHDQPDSHSHHERDSDNDADDIVALELVLACRALVGPVVSCDESTERE